MSPTARPEADLSKMLKAKTAYQSIFLDDDWAHQNYYGWRVVEDLPGLRVLRKQRPAVTRSLLLLSKSGETALPGAVTRSLRGLGVADVLIHDFDNLLPESPLVAERLFHRASSTERLLNIATYVVDLGQNKSELWNKLGPKSRNVIRKAEQVNTKFIIDFAFSEFMEHFYKFYETIAKNNALDVPDYDVLAKMYKNGNLMFVSATDHMNQPVLVNILYTTKSKAFYMYGASDSTIGAGVGQFAQWQTMLHLKSLDYQWYDLGGVQGQDSTDGIHKFKKSIGGTFFDVGSEFRYASPGFEFLRASIARMRNTIRRPTRQSGAVS